MKEQLKYNVSSYILLISFVVCLYSCGTSPSNRRSTIEQLEVGFAQVPDTIQTSVYWYWISDNLSKEGVIKDLHSMKEVGINRAFIGNIGLPENDQPYGSVKLLTDEWWDILHAALKTATELNIEIGIFNSPGWSQSGGPWVETSQAMRYMTFSEKNITGPQKISTVLAKPNEVFQDVKVLAYPSLEKLFYVNKSNAKITANSAISNLDKLIDGTLESEVVFSSGGNHSIDIALDEEQTLRTISIFPSERPIRMNVEFQVKEGEQYKTIRKFNLNRTNSAVNVGFNPYGPVVIALPSVVGKSFRINIEGANPNCGIKEVLLTSQELQERYVEKTLAKMHQTPLPYWHDYLWNAQPATNDLASVVRAKDIIDITQYMDESGKLTWDVPEGDWKILRTGMTPTNAQNAPASAEGVGLEIDKMSKEHVEKHFDAFLGEIIRKIPAEDRKTWKVVVQDSYETGGQNWTDNFIEEFEKRYAYSPVPFIPTLDGTVVESRDITDRFQWDLRRLVADKVSYDYVGGLRDISHKHGLTTWLENYGHWGFPGEFLQYGGQSDEIGGEFWSEGELGDIENKAASSCGHIYGKTKISAESFTCAGAPFSRYPAKMKQRGDRFFTEGINNTLLHVYIHQAYEDKMPGMNAWFGNEFNRKNTWFYDLDVFLAYIKRCNYMLQQGTYVGDVAYFIGEDAPKMTGVCDPALPKGYSFDYINAEVIMERLSVENGLLTLPDGLQYKVLVLPKLETMRPELLTRISELVNAGAVVLGAAPQYSPSYEGYPAADLKVKELAASLWGDVDGKNKKYAQVGKGMIACNMEMQELFDVINLIPDFAVKDSDPVLYIHRTLQNGEVYFVSNQSENAININPSFRVEGLVPELWDPVTATRRLLPEYKVKNGKTIVPLFLEPLESAFIVFKSKSNLKATSNKNYPDRKFKLDLSDSWTVAFDQTKGGPKNPIEMQKLTDWTSFENDSIKYYSGTAIYKKEFNYEDVKKNKSIYLDLDKLTAMAAIKINGVEVGKVWTSPWRVDISNYLKSGKNNVEIHVVNNWMNRLIGDSGLPEIDRITWVSVNHYSSKDKLQPSGLFGPVVIYEVEY